jgi:hypothetical protein
MWICHSQEGTTWKKDTIYESREGKPNDYTYHYPSGYFDKHRNKDSKKTDSSDSSDDTKSEQEKNESDADTISKVVDDVIRGEYGNGQARKEALQKAGFDYDTIQSEVNKKLLNKSTVSKPSSSKAKTKTKDKSKAKSKKKVTPKTQYGNADRSSMAKPSRYGDLHTHQNYIIAAKKNVNSVKHGIWFTDRIDETYM